MPTGTKVVLAVLGLLVGVLVVYYGFMLPDPGLTTIDETEDSLQFAETAGNEGSGSVVELVEGTPASNPPVNGDPRNSPGMLTASLDTSSETNAGTPSTPPVVIPRDSLTPPEVILPSSIGNSEGFADRGESSSTPLSNKLTNQLATKPDVARPVVYTDYYVKEGDTLSEIAQSWFGNANKWDAIIRVNRGLDPLRLQIGQRILLPSHEVTPTELRRIPLGSPGITSARTNTRRFNTQSLFHIVRAGESLSRISGDYYGSAAYWERIFIANRLTLNGNPDMLRVGMKLIIPPSP
ncbi:MAG: LysM peptidoglycan-binding domain-containing protein [Planctomycetes bacterium]|nr:LysM peptidoglycan-binding domain-containing protein [Planctomycetota bacterium]